jgi:hypothetical protein
MGAWGRPCCACRPCGPCDAYVLPVAFAVSVLYTWVSGRLGCFLVGLLNSCCCVYVVLVVLFYFVFGLMSVLWLKLPNWLVAVFLFVSCWVIARLLLLLGCCVDTCFLLGCYTFVIMFMLY